MYHYASSSWQQVGSDIVGSSSEGYYATKVSLSSDGKVLAVGIDDTVGSSYDWEDYNATVTGRVHLPVARKRPDSML